ncbi:MAG: HAD family hydrolase [Caldilineaceae bacterium]|nr:HAD family hydrolase [Caldilineaceae bacterium]
MKNQDTNQPNPHQGDSDYDHLNSEGMEALTLEELDEFMKRAKARAATFREADRTALGDVGPVTDEETPVALEPSQLARLTENFFPELPELPRARRLVQGIIFDFDNTLARLKRPIDELMREGAKNAEAYMRATGMDDLPEEFWESIVEARIFAQTKSDDEQEEHIAEDTLSFLLQFFGYPASKMDPDVLHRAVDLFYAPEMTSWEAMPGAVDLLRRLSEEGYKLAIIANYSCDRVFQRMVDYVALRPYLDTCLSSAAVEWRKPGRDIYDAVLKRWDAEPYEIVCVGDSLKHDIAGGIDLGAQTIHCRMIPLAEDERIVETVHPDEVVEDLDEIPALIHAWS